MSHIPVLLKEVVDKLRPKAGETVLDATAGRGGHAKVLGEQLGPSGHLILLDADQASLSKAHQNVSSLACRVTAIRGNFRRVNSLLDETGVKQVNVALFDLGFSSDQLTESGRGFSFLTEEPLLMTLADLPEEGLTAYEVVNEWCGDELERIFRDYGEERHAKVITQAIIIARREAPIATTRQLAELIRQVVPRGYANARLHPATRTFQALRIAVNSELEALAEGMTGIWAKLVPGGRLGVISFHSLEAKIVKTYFKSLVASDEGELLTKHALKPEYAEVKQNPRARSAQLRVIAKKLILKL
ncbi:MAG: 16S rRNA (cytosine(1402)-N(4))-methyltransferase RsmH [Candidatus Vogelbacteria bacterium]|nr:16S rRNA (cytosine(1402)-N(4))-methyltransferase RsmH [Candidatus Vogelbacteria bacterium]